MVDKITKSPRNEELDMARALSCLFIVCFLHLMGYSPEHSWFSMAVMPYIEECTKIALGTFVFISGYFIGKKSIKTKSDITLFYRKRLAGFYLMFFVAVSSMYVLSLIFDFFWFPSFFHFILSLVGLAQFSYNPATFWFVEMLIGFYLISPFILICSSLKGKVTTIFLTYFIMCGCFLLGHFEYRSLIYFPVFVFAMFTPTQFMSRLTKDYRILLFVLSILIVVNFLHVPSVETTLFKVPEYIVCTMLGVTVVIGISSCLCHCCSCVRKGGNFIASFSMSAYLFHRHVYFFVSLIPGSFSSVWHNLMAALFMLACTFCIQILFNSFQKWMCAK